MVLLGAALGLCCKRANPGRAREKSPTTTVPSASFVATQLQDGDLIFQESTSRQSEMVRALTNSRWTHMGVVFNEAGGPIVLEAVSPVGKAPLQKWIARGRDGRYVVKRLRDADNRLSKEVVGRMQKLGASWLGRPYDLRFRWDDQALYCSELAYKLFERAAGIRVGKLERAADMNLADERVQKALEKRFAGAKFDPSETVVTPDSIFNDDQLVDVER
jgi:hypothetical protein